MIQEMEHKISKMLAHAQLLISKRKYQDALTTLSFLETLGTPPSELHQLVSLGYSMKALCFRMLSELNKAIRHYEKALSLNGNSVTALTGLASLYSSLSRHQKAKSIFERALSIDPKNISAKKGLVRANRMLGMNASDNSMLRDEIADLLASAEESITNDDTALARKALFKILMKDPLHLDALNGLSVCDIMEQKTDRAMEKISTVLNIDAHNETATANFQYLKGRIPVAVNQ